MAEDWAGIAEEVLAALQEVGFTVTLLQAGEKSGPNFSPSIPLPTSFEFTAIDRNIQIRDQTGTLIGQTMRQLMMGVGAVEPTQRDKIVVKGKTHTILDVKPTAPGGVTLFWRVRISD